MGFELRGLEGVTLMKVLFIPAIHWDWKLVLVLVVISIFPATYLVTSLRSMNALSSRKQHGKRPPVLPYWIPFVGSLVSFVWDGPRLAAKLTGTFGQSVPAGLQLGPVKMYVVGSPSHINSLFKTTPAISSNMAIVIGMKNVFGTPKDVLPLYAEDDSGQLATPVLGSHVRPENRMRFFHWKAAHQHLAGSNGIKLGERFMSILSRRISTDKSIGAEWMELPDLFQFMQNLVFPAAVESLLGSTILSLHPTLNDDFWAFVNCVPTLLKGFPRWLSPLAYKRRDKMLKMIKEWHTFANKFSDFTKTEVNDPEWDQYLGSKYVKARQGIFHGIEMMNADGAASEDLGLLFAVNANSITAVFWTIFEVFARPDLLTRVRDISQSAYVTRDQKSESVQLGNNPLLQSIFAETTRLRVAGIISRIPKGGDYQLGEWSIPEGSVLALSSCTGAMNKDIWNEGTAEEPHPLDCFWGERFLIYSNKPDSGPLRKKKINTPTTENKQSATPGSTPEKPSDEPVFSLSGLNGAYLPFGGGAGSCPGRHFARQEVVSTLAILVRHFDIELRVRENWTPRMDTSFFPTGVLPPADKVPFRIRRRQLSE